MVRIGEGGKFLCTFFAGMLHLCNGKLTDCRIFIKDEFTEKFVPLKYLDEISPLTTVVLELSIEYKGRRRLLYGRYLIDEGMDLKLLGDLVAECDLKPEDIVDGELPRETIDKLEEEDKEIKEKLIEIIKFLIKIIMGLLLE